MGLNFAKNTTDTLLKNISWISIVAGLLLFVLSLTDIFVIKVNTGLEKVGLTILTSGVFAAVLKSFQFIGVFKKEIENVILDSSFLTKRSDLDDLWKKISKIIYNKKFPEISDDLESIILNSYFPTNHEYYYEDAIITINVEELDVNDNIKYTQTIKFKVVLAENIDEISMVQNYTVDKIDNVAVSNSERIFYKIDGVDNMDKMEVIETETDFKIQRDCTLKISGKKSFILEIKEKRQYCIKNDNVKLFRVNSITKEMDVSISYPDNVHITFFNVGVIKRFEPKHIENKNTICRIHKNGLILPHQGFGLTFVSK